MAFIILLVSAPPPHKAEMVDRKGIPYMRKKLIALSVALLTIGGSLTFTTAARASDSVLMDTGLRWCANCYDGWGISAGESNWIAFQFTATSAARITEMQFYMDATMSAFDGTTVGIYRDFTSAPKDPANLVGTLTFDGFDADPNVPSGFSGAASFTGSIDIPTAGTYWLKFGDRSIGSVI